MVAAQDALQGSLEHSLKLSQPTRVFQAVLSYVALVWSEAIVIVAYSGRYTKLRPRTRQKCRALASGRKTLASKPGCRSRDASHAAQLLFQLACDQYRTRRHQIQLLTSCSPDGAPLCPPKEVLLLHID